MAHGLALGAVTTAAGLPAPLSCGPHALPRRLRPPPHLCMRMAFTLRARAVYLRCWPRPPLLLACHRGWLALRRPHLLAVMMRLAHVLHCGLDCSLPALPHGSPHQLTRCALGVGRARPAPCPALPCLGQECIGSALHAVRRTAPIDRLGCSREGRQSDSPSPRRRIHRVFLSDAAHCDAIPGFIGMWFWPCSQLPAARPDAPHGWTRRYLALTSAAEPSRASALSSL